jgi:hypothetical protein
VWIPLVSEEKEKERIPVRDAGDAGPWANSGRGLKRSPRPFLIFLFIFSSLFFCFSFVIFAKQFQIDFKQLFFDFCESFPLFVALQGNV